MTADLPDVLVLSSPNVADFDSLLRALGYEVGSARGDLIGQEAGGRRYLMLKFSSELERAAASLMIGRAVGASVLDKAALGQALGFEADGLYFLFWTGAFGWAEQ